MRKSKLVKKEVSGTAQDREARVLNHFLKTPPKKHEPLKGKKAKEEKKK